MPADERATAVQLAAERLAIADRLRQKAGTLSRGLRQRLAIAQSIVHHPPVLLLDEPASGLDPEARVGLAETLLRLREEGMTIIVSSHILSELEDYSTHMLILRGGRLVEQRALGTTSDGRGAAVTLRLARHDDRLEALLRAEASVGQLMVEGLMAQFQFAGESGRARHAAAASDRRGAARRRFRGRAREPAGCSIMSGVGGAGEDAMNPELRRNLWLQFSLTAPAAGPGRRSERC